MSKIDVSIDFKTKNCFVLFFTAIGIFYSVYFIFLQFPNTPQPIFFVNFKNTSANSTPVSSIPNYSNISEIELEYNFDYKTLIESKHLTFSKFCGQPLVGFKSGHGSIYRYLANWILALNKDTVKPDKVKCGDIVFIQTEFLKQFLEKYHPKIKFPYILIAQESDESTGIKEWQREYLNDSKLIMWFSRNAGARHPKLRPIPLGILPRPDFQPINTEIKESIPFFEKKYLVYLSFSNDRKKKSRVEAMKYFATTFANNSKVMMFKSTTKRWKEYLQNLKNSQFVISPPGHGIDCFRTWEALAMGSVPIVLKNGLQPLYDEMPVLVVGDWKEVTEERLEKFKKEEMTNFSKDGFPWRPKLWLRYWINEIMDVKFDYIKNHC